jgi:site-specific recombinase XerD
MKLRAALDRFVLQTRADGRSKHTIAAYQRHVELLDRWLATYGFSDDLDEILPEVLAGFLTSNEARESAHGGTKTSVSLNAVRTSLRVFFGWLHDAGLARTNAARLVRRAITSSAPPRALSDLEVQRLLDALTVAQGPVARRDHMLVALLLGTGARIGSVIALDVEDVDLDSSTLTLREFKGDRVERVFFGAALRDHLVGFLAHKPKSGPLFRGPQGERLSKRQAQKRIDEWFERAGISATPHSLRHTFGTRLLRKTGDLFLVQRAMRHRSVMSTTVYLSLDDQRLKAALQ